MQTIYNHRVTHNLEFILLMSRCTNRLPSEIECYHISLYHQIFMLYIIAKCLKLAKCLEICYATKKELSKSIYYICCLYILGLKSHLSTKYITNEKTHKRSFIQHYVTHSRNRTYEVSPLLHY